PLHPRAGDDAGGETGSDRGAAPSAHGGADEIHTVALGAGAAGPDHSQVPARLPDEADARARPGRAAVDGPGRGEPSGDNLDEVRLDADSVHDRQSAVAAERDAGTGRRAVDLDGPARRGAGADVLREPGQVGVCGARDAEPGAGREAAGGMTSSARVRET